MKVYQAATKAMIAEKAARCIYKKKAGGGVDWICVLMTSNNDHTMIHICVLKYKKLV
jgi:hypothetical protein